jgi:hypothetical protein
LLVGFSWLMPRDYGKLLLLQNENSEGFFTASIHMGGNRVYHSLEFGS